MTENGEKNSKSGFFKPANILVIAGVALGGLAISLVLSVVMPYSFAKEKEKTVYITYGSGFKKISKELDSAGILRNKFVFDAYVVITGTHRKMKAGEYGFTTRDSMNAIAGKMARGEVLKHKITVPEGSDIYDIADIMAANKVADREIFLRLVNDKAFLKSVGINYCPAEGLLFPDTYYFVLVEGVLRIIEAMWGR